MRTRAVRSGLLALAVSCVLSCPAIASTTFTVTNIAHLVQIESGEGNYALWAYTHGAYTFVGSFNMDTDSQHMRDPLTGERFTSFTTPLDLSTASLLLLTVEAASSDFSAPSTHRIMGGDVISAKAVMDPGHSVALNLDFGDVGGSFILDTPSTASTSDFASGVWFLQPGATDGAALSLPALPEGWIYESWVTDAAATDAIPMSMGEFADPNGPDENGAGGGAGAAPCPGFPGQDFIYPFLDQPVMPNLAKGAWTLVVSIEPHPNTGPSPFHSLEPLVCFGIGPLARRQSQALVNNAAEFPSMNVSISTSTPAHPTSWGAIKAGFAR